MTNARAKIARICRRLAVLVLPLLALMTLALLTHSAPELASAADAGSDAAATQPDLAYGFPVLGRVTVFRPTSAPRALVVLLSDAAGWTPGDRVFARRLTAEGALVTGISTPDFLRALSNQTRCINPNYAIITLARDIQHKLDVPMYLKPVLLGRGLGGTLAYATLAAGPDGAYRAAITSGIHAFLPGRGHWCKSGVLALKTRPYPHAGWWIAPAAHLPSPWIVVTARGSPTLPRAFPRRVDGTRILALPTRADQDRQLAAQVVPYLTPLQAPVPRGAAPLPAGLPLTIVADPASPRTDRMAVIFSGDGGWVGLDKGVAGELAKAGIPVVGVDSLSYFWSERTPAGAAADLAAIIRGYSAYWHRPRILLIGYSFGADVLPHIVGHLAPPVRSQVQGMALLGLSATADFQFHLGSWLNIGSTGAYPTVPAIARLPGLPMLCVRGNRESDSACPQIPRGMAAVVTVPGGHHFDRNAPLLVRQILTRLPR
ncbi:AcvB/VirJ family lysyl-phosphatidylglycerol hydrolase [Sphingobium mellinum]|uniref:AcvB/VirJ family lysyl-phosphatidylglycerol hydrolase n=1 Tax=Sphingobium mellinum TaxID=1387166 RepID=UPI0030EECFA5